MFKNLLYMNLVATESAGKQPKRSHKVHPNAQLHSKSEIACFTCNYAQKEV